MSSDNNPKISVQIDSEIRQDLSDVAMILNKTEKAVVEAAVKAYLDALRAKLGDRLTTALGAIKAARDVEL